MSNGIPMAVWNTMTDEQKRAVSEAMQAKRVGKTSLKVSNKGGVSVYGLNRFPVTLYAEQWATVFAMAEEIKTFIESNKALIEERLLNPIESKTE